MQVFLSAGVRFFPPRSPPSFDYSCSMCPTSIIDSRRNAVGLEGSRKNAGRSHNNVPPNLTAAAQPPPASGSNATPKIRVWVSSQNQLLREALCRVLGKLENLELIDTQPVRSAAATPFEKDQIDVLLMVAGERIQADIERIAAARTQRSGVRV